MNTGHRRNTFLIWLSAFAGSAAVYGSFIFNVMGIAIFIFVAFLSVVLMVRTFFGKTRSWDRPARNVLLTFVGSAMAAIILLVSLKGIYG